MRPPYAATPPDGRCPRSPSAYGVAPRARGSTRALEKLRLSLLSLLLIGTYSVVLGYERSTEVLYSSPILTLYRQVLYFLTC